MTTIRDLPEEILRMIFEHVGSGWCLLEAQQVCRAWYLPAHIASLKKVALYGDKAVQFIRSIETNPHLHYLNAVKSINIDISDNNPQFRKTRFKKIFFRFPNLERVCILDMFTLNKVLDDRLCENFLKCCPKLKKFEIHVCHYDQAKYCKVLYKARKLVTHLDIGRFEQGVSQFGSMLKFLSGFPRLRKVECYIEIDCFQQIVPVFKQWPYLNSFSIQYARDDDIDYIETRSKEEEDELVERLSKIYYLDLSFSRKFCLNTTKFVQKYITNLTSLHISSVLNRTWSDTQQRLFCDYALNLFSSTKSSSVAMGMNFEVLKEYLQIFVHKISVPEKQNVLQIFLSESKGDLHSVNISIRKEEDVPKHIINVSASMQLSLLDMTTLLFKKNIQITEVNKLVVDIDHRSVICQFSQKADVDMYDRIMKATLSKELSLAVPLSFEESVSTCNDTYPQVEKLIFRATAKAKFQMLLDRCSSALPNLKHLGIYYFSGIWKEKTNEFKLDLNGYSIDTLVVDITPVYMKYKTQLDEKKPVDEFLVVKAATLANDKTCLYKLPFDLSSVTRIQDNDLKQLTNGKDYHQVHITIASVQQLKISIDNGFYADMEIWGLSVYKSAIIFLQPH